MIDNEFLFWPILIRLKVLLVNGSYLNAVFGGSLLLLSLLLPFYAAREWFGGCLGFPKI